MTTLATETWTGTTGAAWPAQWTTTVGTATIQNNMGRLFPASGAFSVAYTLLSGMTAVSSTEVVADVLLSTAGTAEAYADLAVQAASTGSTGNNLYPANGYDLGFFSNTGGVFGITLGRCSGGTRTQVVGNTTVPGSTTVPTRIRFRVVGGVLQVRAWLSTDPEPDTWTATYTDATPLTTTGQVRWATGNGAATTQRDWRLDNLTVTDAASSGTAPVVNAGADATITVDTAFARTATESDGGSPITARAWTIVSGPTGAGTTIGTAAALSWTPTVTGSYVLRYSATNSVGTGTDDVTVTVPYPTGTPMQFWQAAVAAKNATAVFIGDSLTEGQGASTKAKRWLDLIQTPARTNAGVAGGGVGYLPSWYSVYSPDSTWTPYSSRAGTHANDIGTYSPGRRADTMSAGATTTFTVTGTSADLWWIAGYGSFTYKVDSGSAVTVNTAGTTGAPTRTTITLGAAGSHTVVITATTAVHFAGLMVYDGDSSSGIRFADAAKVGSFSGDFAGMGAVWANFAPDLAVIELGVNDYLHTPASSAQVKTNIKALVSDVRAAAGKSLSIAVVLPAPVTATPDAGQTEAWSAYKTAIQAVATEDSSVQLISWESLGSAPSANYRSDNLHYSDAGHQAVANLMTAALTSTTTKLDKLRLGSGTVTLRVGTATPSALYVGATKVWP